MYTNILVTIDLNHPASWANALPQAVEMTRAAQGQLHVLSVVPDFGTALVEGFFPEGFRPKVMAKAAANLDALVAAEVPADVAVKTHLGYGAVHEEILKAIKSTGADLVVMASHAPDTMREFLVGSQADRVVRRSPVSVLVVRSQ